MLYDYCRRILLLITNIFNPKERLWEPQIFIQQLSSHAQCDDEKFVGENLLLFYITLFPRWELFFFFLFYIILFLVIYMSLNDLDGAKRITILSHELNVFLNLFEYDHGQWSPLIVWAIPTLILSFAGCEMIWSCMNKQICSRHCFFFFLICVNFRIEISFMQFHFVVRRQMSRGKISTIDH